jgi:UDP-glucose:(heptosyl)LPS alpha-1,3-glucosyltransferase
VTPSLSWRGGTEKCLSWLAEGLAAHVDVTVIAGEVVDTDMSSLVRRRVPMIMRPRLARYVSFLVANTVLFGVDRLAGRRRYDVILATGGDCLFADVVNAHFCAAAWSDRLHRGDVVLPSTSVRRRLRNAHYRVFLGLASRVERGMYRQRGLRRVVAVSAGTKHELIRYYGVRADRIDVVPNMVDERIRLPPSERASQRREIRTRHQVPDDALVLLFVAAGDFKRKGLQVVLDALALVPNPSVRLLVVGHEDIDYYVERSRALGIADRVVFAGYRRDIEGYYAAADCFVYPSAYEAFSLVSLEAAGAGLPLIVTRINGTEELVVDGENGFFVEATGSSVAAKVQLLVDDPELHSRLADGARRSSLRFTRERVVEGILRSIDREASVSKLRSIPSQS